LHHKGKEVPVFEQGGQESNIFRATPDEMQTWDWTKSSFKWGRGGGVLGMMDSLRLHRPSQVSLNMFYNVSLRIHSNLEALDLI
jgi:hypothetical protein